MRAGRGLVSALPRRMRPDRSVGCGIGGGRRVPGGADPRPDDGSGSVLVLAASGVILAITAGLVGVAGAHAVRQRAAAAADSAALAAADTASGLVGGYPCDSAGEASRLAGAELLSCVVHETEVQVQVRIRYGVLGAVVTARAGPPPADSGGRKLSDDLQD